MSVIESSAAIRMLLGCERRQCEMGVSLALLFYRSLGVNMLELIIVTLWSESHYEVCYFDEGMKDC